MCRSRRELSNEYLLANFGFDTAENEPCKSFPALRVQIPQVNLTMVVSDYSFMMDLLLPPMTPDDHQFSMILRDQFGETKDAAMNIQIGDMVFGLRSEVNNFEK